MIERSGVQVVASELVPLLTREICPSRPKGQIKKVS